MHGSFKVWIFSLPWVELMFNEKGARMHHVHCMVCTFVEGKKKNCWPQTKQSIETPRPPQGQGFHVWG